MEISTESAIEEIIEKCPESLKLFEKYNIQVFICGEPIWDNLNSICEKYEIDKTKFIEELKTICSNINSGNKSAD
jgi:hypothetical protein